MVHQEPVESLGQVGGPIAGSQGGILPLQKRRLVLDGIPGIKTNKLSQSFALHYLLHLISFLSMMSCWDRLITPMIPSLTGMTRPQRMSMASVPASIRSSWRNFVRKIFNCTDHLGDDGQGAPAVRVDFSGELEGFRGGHVSVSRAHSQDNRVRVGDVFQDELPDLFLDVLGLVSHSNLISAIIYKADWPGRENTVTALF